MADQVTSNITGLLQQWARGNPDALDELTARIYPELRRIAEGRIRRHQRDITMDAPALVHEAYLRFVQLEPAVCENRSRFFALASSVMRGILVDTVRARMAEKRGGPAQRVTLSGLAAVSSRDLDPDVLDVDAALHVLAGLDTRQARIVEMRYFGGLSIEETASLLGLSVATVNRDWNLAKSWLRVRLAGRSGLALGGG